ncbi:XRE family transcriptional regulator [Lactococcus lactis subsp. lactis]|uniref:XRE family transcriptional regulator n=1 Tax=Lactococcus lactis subsp. lactis TaxID=1360 RepID=A0A2Z3KGZ9_LACLL|nr:helix-turn-helix transcriptional regulator [Lactococcus lactis]AWN66980.1 XRE family transcriptional regulator [Lactococcus lactis subsp. lactis]
MIEIIQQKMREKKLSQSQLASLVGIKQQYISKILLGRVNKPSFEIVVKIAEVLDIDLNQFKKKGK